MAVSVGKKFKEDHPDTHLKRKSKFGIIETYLELILCVFCPILNILFFIVLEACEEEMRVSMYKQICDNIIEENNNDDK